MTRVLLILPIFAAFRSFFNYWTQPLIRTNYTPLGPKRNKPNSEKAHKHNQPNLQDIMLRLKPSRMPRAILVTNKKGPRRHLELNPMTWLRIDPSRPTDHFAGLRLAFG